MFHSGPTWCHVASAWYIIGVQEIFGEQGLGSSPPPALTLALLLGLVSDEPGESKARPEDPSAQGSQWCLPPSMEAGPPIPREDIPTFSRSPGSRLARLVALSQFSVS